MRRRIPIEQYREIMVGAWARRKGKIAGWSKMGMMLLTGNFLILSPGTNNENADDEPASPYSQ